MILALADQDGRRGALRGDELPATGHQIRGPLKAGFAPNDTAERSGVSVDTRFPRAAPPDTSRLHPCGSLSSAESTHSVEVIYPETDGLLLGILLPQIGAIGTTGAVRSRITRN